MPTGPEPSLTKALRAPPLTAAWVTALVTRPEILKQLIMMGVGEGVVEGVGMGVVVV